MLKYAQSIGRDISFIPDEIFTSRNIDLNSVVGDYTADIKELYDILVKISNLKNVDVSKLFPWANNNFILQNTL